MDNSSARSNPTSMPLANCSRPLPWLTASILVVVLGLSACDRRSESNPGSSPAAIGSGSKSSGRSDAGTPSDGVEVRTPSAPDSRGGGSSGFKGSKPTADTSGGPTSDKSLPGVSSSGTASGTSSAPTGSASSGVQSGATVPVTPPR